MGYVKFILDVLLFTTSAYFFVRVIYGKIKLHGVRIKMQKEGLIREDFNIIWLTIFSVFFWIIPVSKFKSLRNTKHNKEAMTINISLLGLLVVIISFILLGKTN